MTQRRPPSLLLSTVCALPLLFYASCSDDAAAAENPLQPPVGLEDTQLAASTDELTAAKYELGKMLFFDQRISGTGNTSCSSCHLPEHAFTDRRAHSPKDNGGLNTRNSPTMYNVGYLTELYWDGRAKGLEKNVLAAWTGQCGGKPDDVATKLAAIEGYKQAFDNAYGAAPSQDNIVKALAAFLRGLRSGDSAYDRYRAGDESAMSEAAMRGWNLFSGKAGCLVCHQPPLFTDRLYHNVGIGMTAETPDIGRGKEEQDKRGAFKTPTLREVSKTAPYLHDGSIQNLREVVVIMANGGIDNPHKDPLMIPRGLTDEEIDDVVAFLECLTGNQPFTSPELPK